MRRLKGTVLFLRLAGTGKVGMLYVWRMAASVSLALSGLAGAQLCAQSNNPPLVQHALANELRNARDPQHPMRYRLHKASPRLSQTKYIYETRDGGVAELVAVNGQPLSGEDAAKEKARLDALLADPTKQQSRKTNEEKDAQRALKVLRALPVAFIYEYAGNEVGKQGPVAKFNFRPNPNYDPPDMETRVLDSMQGQIWIDVKQERVERLEGSLIHDVDYGWGLLGRLYKGGWIELEQAPVYGNQWRIVHFKMDISGRILFKTKEFQTVENTSDYEPLPLGMSYAQAIEMMRNRNEEVGKLRK
ncbi:MAG: hypothetical protein KGN79_06765 [Acidobacteriota bacterium]|nr:hypothetical protein [Acidobacteriota bacterium]